MSDQSGKQGIPNFSFRMTKCFARSRRLIMALLLAMLVIVPAIDAAACMVEPETIQPDIDSDPDTADHAVCGHGHCHHTGTQLVPSFAYCPLVVHTDLVLAPERLAPESLLPEGLKRPPRV